MPRWSCCSPCCSCCCSMRFARRAASSPRRSTAARRRAHEWRSGLRSASRPFRANNNKISLLCERERERTIRNKTNFQLEIRVDVAPSSSTSFPKKRSTRGTPLFVGRVLSSTQKPPRCPSLSLSLSLDDDDDGPPPCRRSFFFLGGDPRLGVCDSVTSSQRMRLLLSVFSLSLLLRSLLFVEYLYESRVVAPSSRKPNLGYHIRIF